MSYTTHLASHNSPTTSPDIPHFQNEDLRYTLLYVQEVWLMHTKPDSTDLECCFQHNSKVINNEFS